MFGEGFYTTILRWRRHLRERIVNDSLLTQTASSRKYHIAIAWLVLLGCLIMVNASSVVDTARDVYNAWQIADGNHFPLEGPYVGGVFHGGPVWFYILAVPLLVTSSWIVMSLWVGLLTSMKYVLAYACGARLVDRKFGLMWAYLLAFPDWTSINYLIFSHTNLIETSLLLYAYCLIRWQQGSARWFVMLCLAIGLGIHAHPTVYAAGLVTIPFVVRSLWRKDLAWWWLPAGALAAAVPLIPYIISQTLQQWPDLQTGQGFFASQPLWMNLQGFWDVLQGALFDGPLVALQHVLGLHGAALIVAGLLISLVLGGGVCLSIYAIFRRSSGPLPLLLLSITLLCIAAVALIRNVTPFYQTYVIYPPFYAVVAWGWWYALKPVSSGVLRSLIAISSVSLIGTALATFNMGREGHLKVPPTSLMDVRTHQVHEFADSIYYPGWGRQQLGSFICSQKGPLFFHGFASLVLEQSYALGARMRCDSAQVFVGGQGEGRHYLGIANRDARHLGLRTGTPIGSMSLYEIDKVIAPSQALSVPTGDIYPPRPYYSTGESELTLEFTTSSKTMLAVTNLYYFWMPYSVEVSLDGQPVEPQFRSMVNAYYGCPDCLPENKQNWSVSIKAPKPELVEVVTFVPTQPVP